MESIFAQTYSKWEILAVDDHSADQSRPIMDFYAKKDQRIRVFSNKGSGIIEALRLAFAQSKGRLITRMDSDDIMAPNKLETMVHSLLRHGKGHIAVGLVHYFSKKGISNGYQRYERWLNSLTQNGSNYSEIYKECVIPSPCWMAYKTDLEHCGAFMPNNYPEDYDLAFRFYGKGLRCIPCSEVLHLWRDYDTRTSRTSPHYAQNYFLDIKLHYFLKLDLDRTRPLVLWGAGNKGKTIAKKLINLKIDFNWLCDNPKKVGKTIYGKAMLYHTFLETLACPQSIITVANDEAQSDIKDYLQQLKHVPMVDYFFFC